MPTPAQLCTLSGISQRGETIRYDLLDASNVVIGQVEVQAETTIPPTSGADVPRAHHVMPPIMQNDVSRVPHRQLQNMVIAPSSSAHINPVTQRIRPVWRIQNPATPGGYDDYPLGVFLFADATAHLWSWGLEMDGTMHDQGIILAQPIVSSITFAPGTPCTTAILAVAAMVNLGTPTVDASPAVIGTPNLWAAGRDTYEKVLEDLCSLAGFLPPYFDNLGTLVCRQAPDLGSAVPDFSYGLAAPGIVAGAVLEGTVTTSSDLLTAPNIYIAVDTGSTASPIVGVYAIPDSAPNSYSNRGFWVPKVLQQQGLGSPDAAQAMAKAAYSADPAAFTWVGFGSVVDPRHDTFNIVAFNGVNYREANWRMRLEPGAGQEHDLRGYVNA